MFNRPTVFVLGAGASAEVGLPVGSGLAEKIGQALDIRLNEPFYNNNRVLSGDQELYAHLLHKFPHEINEYQRAGWRIRDGIPLTHSIDDFLDTHNDDTRLNIVGKTAIVKSILEAERSSKIFYGGGDAYDNIKFNTIEDTWFVKFMRMFGRGTSAKTAHEALAYLTFIVFNYDRCLEQFLLHALQFLYSVTDAEAFQMMASVRIIHPYGVIDEIPTGFGRGGTRFGGQPHRLSADYVGLSSKIRTYTERLTDKELLADMRAEITKAKSIVFLGFAYHKQNMQLLWPQELMDNKVIFGTAFRMSQPDLDVIKGEIASQFKPEVRVVMDQTAINIRNDLNCSQLFDSYARSLTG